MQNATPDGFASSLHSSCFITVNNKGCKIDMLVPEVKEKTVKPTANKEMTETLERNRFNPKPYSGYGCIMNAWSQILHQGICD